MVTTTNLVSYWKLDENAANTTVADAHGSNTGTSSTNTSNLYSASGKINSAFDFNGTGEHVDVGLSSFDALSAFSVNIWVKLPAGTDSGQIISKDGGTATTVEYHMFLNTDGTIRWWVGGGDFVTSTTVVDDGAWHMLTGTSDGTTAELYVDGTSEDTGAVGTETTTGNMWINGRSGANPNYVTGEFDEVALFDAEITSTDVTDLYNSGSGLAYPFSSDVTATPTALSLSLTDEEPTIIVQVPSGSLDLALGLPQPALVIPITFEATAFPLVATLQVPTPITKVDLSITGTVGTIAVNKNYPNIEGLTAGTTKQTGNPNL